MAMKKYESVDQYLEDPEEWRPEMEKLRAIVASTGLEETIKFGMNSVS